MKILIADDSRSYRTLLLRLLEQWGFEVVQAADGQQAWELLQGPEPPQLAILDWMMPGLNGIDLCRRLKADKSRPYTYAILLSARSQSTDLVSGLRNGADDYLSKPFNAEELRARLLVGQRSVELHQELSQVRQQLLWEATHDALTKVFNRRGIIDLLGSESGRSRGEEQPLSVVMLDVDHFKSINDKHGHPAGDEVLARISQGISSVVRGADAVGRYGGEEFLVVLPGADEEAAIAVAERIRRVIAATPINSEGVAITATVSLGVSSTSVLADYDTSSLLHAADQALYRAKNGGRNCVVSSSSAPVLQPVVSWTPRAVAAG